jgi:biotin--protein ligase
MYRTKMTKKNVIIYGDHGVSRDSFTHLSHFLKQSGAGCCLLNAVEVAQQNWEEDALLFVMPGGRDMPYHEKLKGAGIKKIQEFVEMGGVYLGVCAGAYFASSHIEFEKGTPLEIIAERDLKFYKGVAKGPILGSGHFAYHHGGGILYPKIQFLETGLVLPVYYNGGCGFPGAERIPKTKVHALFPNTVPAVIECKVGKGKAILTGVHPEMMKSHKEQRVMKEIFEQLLF